MSRMKVYMEELLDEAESLYDNFKIEKGYNEMAEKYLWHLSCCMNDVKRLKEEMIENGYI